MTLKTGLSFFYLTILPANNSLHYLVTGKHWSHSTSHSVGTDIMNITQFKDQKLKTRNQNTAQITDKF